MQGITPNKKEEQIKRCKSLEKRELVERNSIKRLNHKSSLVNSDFKDATKHNNSYKETNFELNYQELNNANKNREKS